MRRSKSTAWFVPFAASASLLVATAPAYAAYETKSGTINKLEINAPAASARNVVVSLNGVSPICSIPTNNTTAYFNRADNTATFDAMISTLLSARISGANVTLLIETTGAEGCRVDRAVIN